MPALGNGVRKLHFKRESIEAAIVSLILIASSSSIYNGENRPTIGILVATLGFYI